MDRCDFLHGLQFNDERIFYDEIGAETFLELLDLPDNRDSSLPVYS